MSKQVPFHITSGLPFSKTIEVTLPNGRTWWIDNTEFEVLSQIREGEDDSTPLLLDISQYMTVTWNAPNTATIELEMSGANTRQLKKSGYYDVIMSDPLPSDERAIKVLGGPVVREALVTSDTELV